MQHQTQGERVESLEASLEDSNARLKDHISSSTRKIKELDEKLLAAENLCAKFLESGRYWRQERNQKSKATTNKIVMPLMSGGGGSKAKTMPSGPAPTPSPALSASSSPPPLQQQSSSSRLSGGGLAAGARSAINSIQSAISGKPKPPPPAGDSMSAFF